MSTPDVVPVAWIVWREIPGGDDLVLYREAKATVDALQARIDELEAQLFIATTEPALPLFEAMGFGPMPAFPSIRTNQIESKS